MCAAGGPRGITGAAHAVGRRATGTEVVGGGAESNETALDDLLGLAPDRWCAVSFAALISQPMAELRRLAGFIGLDFDGRSLGMDNGLLAVSSSALTLPSPDKWRRNALEIERVLPQAEATAARIENMFTVRSAFTGTAA